MKLWWLFKLHTNYIKISDFRFRISNFRFRLKVFFSDKITQSYLEANYGESSTLRRLSTAPELPNSPLKTVQKNSRVRLPAKSLGVPPNEPTRNSWAALMSGVWRWATQVRPRWRASSERTRWRTKPPCLQATAMQQVKWSPPCLKFYFTIHFRPTKFHQLCTFC